MESMEIPGKVMETVVAALRQRRDDLREMVSELKYGNEPHRVHPPKLRPDGMSKEQWNETNKRHQKSKDRFMIADQERLLKCIENLLGHLDKNDFRGAVRVLYDHLNSANSRQSKALMDLQFRLNNTEEGTPPEFAYAAKESSEWFSIMHLLLAPIVLCDKTSDSKNRITQHSVVQMSSIQDHD